MTRREWLSEAVDWPGPDMARAARLRTSAPDLFGALSTRSITRYLAEQRARNRLENPTNPPACTAGGENPLSTRVCDDQVHTTVFLSDLHVPYHHQPTIDAVTRFVADVGPDLLVLGGDVLDCYQVSKFRRDPVRRGTLQVEVDAAVELLQPMVTASKHVIYLQGNHERRLEKLRWDNVGLHDLRVLNVPALFVEAGLEIEWAEKTYTHGEGAGRVTYLHGYKHALHTAWLMLQREYPGQIMIQGHTHRPDCRAWTTGETTTIACVAGHLSDVEQAGAYADNPHWTRGFVVVEHWADMSQAQVTPVICERSFVWRGTCYGQN